MQFLSLKLAQLATRAYTIMCAAMSVILKWKKSMSIKSFGASLGFPWSFVPKMISLLCRICKLRTYLEQQVIFQDPLHRNNKKITQCEFPVICSLWTFLFRWNIVIITSLQSLLLMTHYRIRKKNRCMALEMSSILKQNKILSFAWKQAYVKTYTYNCFPFTLIMSAGIMVCAVISLRCKLGHAIVQIIWT